MIVYLLQNNVQLREKYSHFQSDIKINQGLHVILNRQKQCLGRFLDDHYSIISMKLLVLLRTNTPMRDF